MTIIEYIYRKNNIAMPFDYIGNMPRVLIKHKWRVLQINQSDLQTGDLIFWGTKRRFIAHIALVLSKEEVFHHSWKKKACIEKIANLNETYQQPNDIKALLTYTDRRS